MTEPTRTQFGVTYPDTKGIKFIDREETVRECENLLSLKVNASQLADYIECIKYNICYPLLKYKRTFQNQDHWDYSKEHECIDKSLDYAGVE